MFPAANNSKRRRREEVFCHGGREELVSTPDGNRRTHKMSAPNAQKWEGGGLNLLFRVRYICQGSWVKQRVEFPSLLTARRNWEKVTFSDKLSSVFPFSGMVCRHDFLPSFFFQFSLLSLQGFKTRRDLLALFLNVRLE